ncbi:MAG: hypothetical protein K0Q59_3666 [Paenibacillus sp.]|nr:hypothetical protein [Paenibacillus sp.]
MNKTIRLLAGACLGLTLLAPTVQASPYTVKEGDTLWKIATAHNTTVQQLMNLNPSVPTMIYPGQTIQLPDDPNAYVVQPDDTFWKIAVRYGLSTKALINANPHIPNPDLLNIGDKLSIPAAPPAYTDGIFPLLAGSYQPYTNTYADSRTWSPDGEQPRAHEGVDIMADKGTPVYSAMDGTVIRYGWNEYGGWRLTIQVGDSTAFYYAHLSGYALGVKLGDTVSKGQLIGYVGNTGYGPEGTSGLFDTHLHFGIYNTNGWTTVDPYSYLTWWESQQ